MGSEPSFDDWDDPWVDDDDPWETAEIDARLRRQVSGLYPPRGDSHQALAELQPLITSARRRRRSKQGVLVSAATVLAVVGGMVAAERALPLRQNPIAAMSDNRPAQVGVDGTADGPSRAEEGVGPVKTAAPPDTGVASTATSPSAVPGATTGPPGSPTPGGRPPGASDDADDTMVTVNGGSFTTAGTGTTRASATSPTTAGSSRTTAPASTTSTTRSPTTTTDSGGRVTLGSRCGSIDVLVGRSRVDLASVAVNAGGRYDIHDSGPTLVDVTLYWRTYECPITAQIRDGRLVTSQPDD